MVYFINNLIFYFYFNLVVMGELVASLLYFFTIFFLPNLFSTPCALSLTLLTVFFNASVNWDQKKL